MKKHVFEHDCYAADSVGTYGVARPRQRVTANTSENEREPLPRIKNVIFAQFVVIGLSNYGCSCEVGMRNFVTICKRVPGSGRLGRPRRILACRGYGVVSALRRRAVRFGSYRVGRSALSIDGVFDVRFSLSTTIKVIYNARPGQQQ